jgi:hypothetical protein
MKTTYIYPRTSIQILQTTIICASGESTLNLSSYYPDSPKKAR